MALGAPLTELEAVNAMLYDVGSRPTTTLISPTRSDVIRAAATLDQAGRTVQQVGWWFNTEKITLAVNGANQYVIPDTLVHVEVISGGPTSGTNGVPKLVVRSRLLYDVVNGTDTFVGADDVVLVGHRLLTYEELPSSARDYVYATASIRFQSRSLGSQQVDQDLKESAMAALANLKEEDADAENYDQTLSDHFFDLMHNS